MPDPVQNAKPFKRANVSNRETETSLDQDINDLRIGAWGVI